MLYSTFLIKFDRFSSQKISRDMQPWHGMVWQTAMNSVQPKYNQSSLTNNNTALLCYRTYYKSLIRPCECVDGTNAQIHYEFRLILRQN